MTEESSKDVVVLQNDTAANTGAPAANTATANAKTSNPFEGTWDVDVNGIFANWTFSYASKKDDKLEGKITDGGGSVIGDYVVFPNKTIQLNVPGVNAIVSYKVSSGGSKIEINDGSTKAILTRGKTNTTAQNDGNILASHIWTNINDPSDRIEFLSVRKSSSGWNGAINLTGSSGNASGTFALTPGKIKLTISGSVDVFTYKLRNNDTTLDLTDSRGNTVTYN
ncbi:MAG: hypothetical protein IT172_05210 [Acidobacteria bacterium]|nr:hypothetical protein [Acidobacteriota bacterium]